MQLDVTALIMMLLHNALAIMYRACSQCCTFISQWDWPPPISQHLHLFSWVPGADSKMASLPETETEMEREPESADAAEISQQLHALASLLGISGEFQQAEKLLDRINQGMAVKVKALPQAFHEPVLPRDSLSDAQVGHCRS